MKFILLIAVIAVLIYIPTGGSPLPKEEKSSSLEESDKNENSSKTEDATTDTSEEVSTKTQKSTTEKGKSKSRAKNEKNKKSVSSTPEPEIEEEENRFYIMVPVSKNQVPDFKQLQPFNFKKIPKMPMQPQYVFKQPRVPAVPFTYPMFTSQDNQSPMMMVPETELEYSSPNMMTKVSDDLPMYYIPPPRSGQPFTNNVNHMSEMNHSPFIFPNKETNPWNTYLENSDYYK